MRTVRAMRLALAWAGLCWCLLSQSVARWDPAFNHDPDVPGVSFNAIHMALIPTGTYRGQVLVWNNEVPIQGVWAQRWAIVDPVQRVVLIDTTLTISGPNDGNLFCAGHAWNQDGKLFVAGGTAQYGPFQGAKLAFLFEPANPNGPTWVRMPDMFQDRWYPTVTTLPNDESMVSGGFAVPPAQEQNDYEVFISMTTPPTWRQFPGNPGLVPGTNDRVLRGPFFPLVQGVRPGRFHSYPRIFVIPNSDGVFVAGAMNQSSYLDRPGGTWNQLANHFWQNAVPPGNPCTPLAVCGGVTTCPVDTPASVATFRRDDCTAVLFPLGPGSYAAAIVGGTLKDERTNPAFCDYLEVSRSVEYCTPAQDSPGPPPFGNSWTATSPLNIARSYANASLLPDGTVLVVGGVDCNPYDSVACPLQTPCLPILPAELFVNGTFIIPATVPPCPASVRNYHSTALLLPDGSVLSAGGDNRGTDYQVFRPAYMDDPTARPTGVMPSQTSLGYNTMYQATFTPPANGASVQKVVLMAPGSVTHSFDACQRHVELVSSPAPPSAINFFTPADGRAAPRGWYMLFLLTNANVPSVAVWVHLQ